MPKIVENALVIYTDGSLYPKGRRGGYGFLAVHFDRVGNETVVGEYAPPGIGGTTNNRMELQATIEAVRRAPELPCFSAVQQLVIRTDSQYVQQNYTTAVWQWSKAKWLNQVGRPVDNADLWKELVRLCVKLRKRVVMEKVKAHAKGKNKDAYNDQADKLAKSAARSPLSRRAPGSIARRKTTLNKTAVGSIKAEWQTLTVRVVSSTWMKVQQLTKYRCEVLTADSPYCGRMDFLYSSLDLREAHHYEVQLNADPNVPTIVDVLREIERT